MGGPFSLIYLPDPRFSRGLDRLEMTRRALRGGATAVQLRDKDLPPRELIGQGRAMRALCREYGRSFFVNDRIDIALACGADGVHLGPDDMPPSEARRILGPAAMIGVSWYGPEDLREAEAAGAAYVAVGAIFPTGTKKIEVVGLEGIRRLRALTSLPVVAIGGIDASRAGEAILAGADGVAVISALSGAGDIEKAAGELLRRVEEALARRG